MAGFEQSSRTLSSRSEETTGAALVDWFLSRCFTRRQNGYGIATSRSFVEH
jgi:hypothetical protein